MNNKFKLDIEYINAKDIVDIKSFASSNASAEVTIRMKSTYGLTSEMLKELVSLKNVFFRVASAYTPEFISKYNNESYLNSLNMYSVIELFHIVQKFEQLENHLYEQYSPLAKAYVVYNQLRSKIVFDRDGSSDLKAILRSSASSMGFAQLSFELLSRGAVNSEIVSGKDTNHIWNYFQFNQNFYMFDLALDAYLFSRNNNSPVKYFANYDNNFGRSHRFNENEKVKLDMFKILSKEELEHLDILTTKEISSSKMYHYIRKDKTTFALARLATFKKGNHELFKYLYCDTDNKRSISVKIFYSEKELFSIVDNKNYLIGQLNYMNQMDNSGIYAKQAADIQRTLDMVDRDQRYLSEEFLSQARLEEFAGSGNSYIGSYYLVNGVIQLAFDKDYPKEQAVSRHYRRTDGSTFVLEQIPGNIYTYNYYHFEDDAEVGRIYHTTLYSDTDIFNFDIKLQLYLVNRFLSVKNIQKASSYTGGYLGKCNTMLAEKFVQNIKSE